MFSFEPHRQKQLCTTRRMGGWSISPQTPHCECPRTLRQKGKQGGRVYRGSPSPRSLWLHICGAGSTPLSSSKVGRRSVTLAPRSRPRRTSGHASSFLTLIVPRAQNSAKSASVMALASWPNAANLAQRWSALPSFSDFGWDHVYFGDTGLTSSTQLAVLQRATGSTP